jgi:hypothetical protein
MGLKKTLGNGVFRKKKLFCRGLKENRLIRLENDVSIKQIQKFFEYL